jgi:hypothetical protein
MSKEWNGSMVMPEFVKIAKETGLISTDFEKRDYVGNPSKDTPVKDHRRYEPGEEYGITKETGKDLVEDAHGKSPTMADAMGAGGLVENIVEQQEKDIEVALKMPRGTLPGVHAAIVSELVRLANRLDSMGKHKEAMRVDETVGRLVGRPFDLEKKAGFWFIPMLVAGIAGTAGSAAWLGLGKHLTSKRESLGEDTKDLLEIFEKAVSKGSTAAEEAVTLLTPISSTFTGLDLKTQLEKYVQQVQSLSAVMPKLKSILAKTKLELGTGRWFHFGFDIASRMDEKMADVEKGLQETKELLGQAQTLAEQGTPETSGVAGLQKLLFEKGFRGKMWAGKATGTMDEATLAAAAELEKMLDEAIAKSGTGLTGSMAGRVVSGGKLAIDVEKLNRIMELLEKV